MTEKASIQILLVDDESDFLQTLATRLKIRGLRVDTAGSGEEAVRKIACNDYEVAIVDLNMPGMDGLETTARIRESGGGCEVIMLTGYGSIRHGVNAMKSGASDFLEKPVEISILLEKIDAAHERYENYCRQKEQAEINRITRTQTW